MAVEEQRLRIRQSLEEKLGVEEASYLMDRPVGGWSELVTNHTLDLKFDVLDERFARIDERFARIDERFARIDERFALIDDRFSSVKDRFRTLEENLTVRIEASADQLRAEMERGFREQTWRLITVVVAALGSLTAIFAVITALVAG